ncbi:hypothetical protein [Anaerotignum sp.]
MMYRRTLEKHWNNLMHDFEKTYCAMDIANVPVSELQRWYNVRSHRFKSIFTEEGKALQGLEQKDLISALTEQIDAFDFCEVKVAGRSSLKNRFILLVVSMTALFFLLPILGLESTLIRLLLGIGEFAVGFLWQLHQMTTAEAKRRGRVVEAYRKQLEMNLQKLLNICDRFGQER